MAESQLQCMEDGRIGETIPESKPEFYYSETHRTALEELLRNGDGAFKTLLSKDNAKDFLSPPEVSVIRSTVEQYSTHEENGPAARQHSGDASSLRSTYWPEVSDTEVPQLDIGWAQALFFKGVPRVTVYAHPPKDNGPHIKEVVRRLIQEAHKVIAIVMDLLTDLQILQDLLDAASRRNVPVYIILDSKGEPHFMDMCNRLTVTQRQFQNIRTRIVRGVGLDLSYGRIPGSLNNKYMLIDGDKVMFGSYSFSWSSSRMDRNMITVMSGPIVDFFDRDFRELYAISRELKLFKEVKVSKPSRAQSIRVTAATRPALPVTSRFQVSLGDTGTLKVPAHKYYNPKYDLAFGRLPEDFSRQALMNKMEESLEKFGAEAPVEEENEMQEIHTPPSSLGSKKDSKMICVPSKKKKKRFSFLRKSKQKGAGKEEEGKEVESEPGPSATTKLTSTIEDIPEEPTEETKASERTKSKKEKKKTRKSSQSEDQGSDVQKDSKKSCVIS